MAASLDRWFHDRLPGTQRPGLPLLPTLNLASILVPRYTRPVCRTSPEDAGADSARQRRRLRLPRADPEHCRPEHVLASALGIPAIETSKAECLRRKRLGGIRLGRTGGCGAGAGLG